MKSCLEEYADCQVQEIVEKYIEEKPQIGEVPVTPDEREDTPLIQGTGVDDTSITEGRVNYDIRFTATVPSEKEKIGLLLNVEAQNKFHPGYPLIKRGIYYCCRMISSQYGTVFTKSHYGKIKKVYSIWIWICTNPPKHRENTINRYALSEENLIGNTREPEKNYDLLSALMICLGDSKKEKGQGILRLLSVLLSSEVKEADKKAILETEYHIAMSQKMEEEVAQMCNLSESVEERGIQKGISQGVLQSLQNIMKNMNLTIKEAMDALEIKEEDRFRYTELLKKNNK